MPRFFFFTIDMSLASLAYARRKAREANVRKYRICAADIIEPPFESAEF